MNNTRLERVNAEIKRKISAILSNEVKDPRITGLISVTDVKTTQDLKFCKIKLSIYNKDEKTGAECFNAIVSSKGFIRSALSKAVDLKFTPELQFERDFGFDESENIDRILKEIHGNN